jgi:hypothetical protein
MGLDILLHWKWVRVALFRWGVWVLHGADIARIIDFFLYN